MSFVILDFIKRCHVAKMTYCAFKKLKPAAICCFFLIKQIDARGKNVAD